MIKDRVLYSPCKDHQHHNWRLLKSWTSCQDYQNAQDKQHTQYLFTSRSKWKMHQLLFKILKSECAKKFYVYHNTNGQNLGPVWKTQSFLLIEICTVIHWQYCSGKGNLRKSFWNTVGRMFPILNACSYTVKKRFILICVCGWHQIGWRETKHLPVWKVLNKEVDLREPTSFFDHENLGCTQKQCEISKDIVDKYRAMFQSRISAGATENLPCSENLCVSSWSCDMEGRAKEFVCNDVVSWRAKHRNNNTKSKHHALTTTNPKKELDLSENCLKIANGLFWNVYIWLVLVDLIFSGPWINLHVPSPYGPKPVTHAWRVWSLTCIIQCRFGLFQEFDFAGDFEDSEATSGGLCCQQVGCARNRHQSQTAQHKLKLFLLMQVYAWTELPRLIFETWWLRYLFLTKPHQEIQISENS